MTPTDDPLATSVVDLRRAFDESFAAPPATDTQVYEGFLSVRIGDVPFAIRARDVAALEAPKKVVPLPADKPAFLGIAAVRGQLIPVYSLALLLGYQESPVDTHWLVLVGNDNPVAFAFSTFEGHLRITSDEIRALALPREHIHEAVQVAGAVRHVVALPSVLQTVTAVSATRRD